MRLWLLVALVLGPALAGCSGTPPVNLGVHDGRLAPCPSSPNCVSSQAPPDDATHWTAPLSYTGPEPEAMARLLKVLEGVPRLTFVEKTPRYVRAEVRSFLFRFVDDLELYFPPDRPGRVEVRSASRLGYSDFGVNRRRVEEIREAFEEPRAGASSP